MKPARSSWSCSTGTRRWPRKRSIPPSLPASDQFPDCAPWRTTAHRFGGKKPARTSKRPCRARTGENAQNVVAAVDSLARLPTRWQGYEGVDIVVISTSKPEVFCKDLPPQNARIEALEQWVRMGGTLVLCAGSHAEEALHAGSPLAKFVPGHFEKTVLLRSRNQRLGNLSAKSPNPIPPPKPGEKVELPTARLTDVQGKIEARESDLPLVIRKPQGLGQVVFVATDLDRGPIRDWSDRPQLVAAILNLPANEQPGETDNLGQNYGYNDLAGQLRSALDVPRDVHLVPFFVVALLVIVYILLIGPGDYFLLRRLGRGMQWTWITFPTIVVALCRRGLLGRLLAQRRPASRQPGRPGRYRRRGHGPRRQLVQHLQPAGRIVRPLHAAPPARRPTAQGGQRFAGLVRQGGQ